jgi:D-alanine-D-alanine ligase
MHGSIFDRPLDILVLMGGPSSEREVSLVSGAAIADALESCGHRVVRGDIKPTDTSAIDGEQPDVVFIALHGEFGEDGQVQQLCEQRGLTYVGSAPQPSELAMDKAASKQIYRKIGLDTPDWVIVEEFDTPAKQAELVERIPLPCVVKPVDGGSSVDIDIVRTRAERDKTLEALLDKYTRAMVERLIEGRELTVGILDSRPLPVLEIRPQREFYDYIAKYDDDNTEYILDHGLTEEIVQATQHAAVSAHEALGCRDMSRSDFILNGDQEVWILETNTIPGFTSHSLLPKAAAAEGMDFAQLCEELVRMAMDRKDIKAACSAEQP